MVCFSHIRKGIFTRIRCILQHLQRTVACRDHLIEDDKGILHFICWRGVAKKPIVIFCGSTCSYELRQKNCRSEEHTSELQSRENLVCRLLLEKKKRGAQNM